MTKSIVAIAAAILAATTLLTSTAQAGMRIHLGFGGVPPYLTNYNKEAAYETRRRAQKRAYRAARRHEQAPVHTAKKVKSEDVAKVEPKVEEAPKTLAQTENSSISVASISETKTGAQTETKAETAAADEPVKTAAATPSERSLDCKKFFPSVGMTLSVPCE
jgi:hypothetical protein